MKCPECLLRLMDAARGRGDERPDGKVLDHAAECTDCGRALANERALQSGLRALARSEPEAKPSPALEYALLAEFRPVHARRHKAWGWALAGSLAAGMVLLALNLKRQAPSEAVFSETGGARNHDHALSNPPALEKPDRAPATGVAAGRKVRRGRAPRTVSAPAGAEEVFILVPYAEPLEPTERTQIVRVNLPVAALARWGLPVEAADPNLRLNADLVLGQDGLARAVGFVR